MTTIAFRVIEAKVLLTCTKKTDAGGRFKKKKCEMSAKSERKLKNNPLQRTLVL